MDETQAIEPIVKTLEVRAEPGHAFAVFTDKLGSWWPLHSHSIAQERDGTPARTCVLEPGVGGRVYEVAADGTEYDWGRVLTYEPDRRVVFSWHVSPRSGNGHRGGRVIRIRGRGANAHHAGPSQLAQARNGRRRRA